MATTPDRSVLRYLYVGSSDTERDVSAWLAVPGARLRWRFRHFGADVAAVDVGSRPIILVADHRPAGSVLPIYAVDDLDAALARWCAGGWHLAHGPVGTPEGPAAVLTLAAAAAGGDATAVALLQVDRPEAMESAYADTASTHAVRATGRAGS